MPPKPIDITGRRFGMLTALTRTDEKENNYYMWECVCDCGKKTMVSTKKLQRGTITNCGCIPKTSSRNGTIPEDITGQHFGHLKALYKSKSIGGKTHWVCLCDCGNYRIASTSMLKAGRTSHCGCRNRGRNGSTTLDLAGKRFGRLLVLHITKKRDYKGSVIWECRCECGNTVETSADSLMHGGVTSCGCRKQEINDSIRDTLTFVDGTCIEWLRSRKHRCDNTSGFRGVYKAKNKWRASIGLKGERYHIGTFGSFEEAKEARLEVEKKLHDDFVLAWDKWSRFAASDPDWASSNPFVFDVKKIDGTIVVHAPILSIPDTYKP